VIDLHTHTTASDGASPPAELVARAAAAGITTVAVTDHDTCAGLGEAAREATRLGLFWLPGIEITAVWKGRDVHLLAYAFDPGDAGIGAFLQGQRDDRIRRARLIAKRLAYLGVPIDLDAAIERARPTTISRPIIAQAMADAGHAATRREAFSRYLADGGLAYVPRLGATPAQVVSLVRSWGGVVSMAHPGVTQMDGLIAPLAGEGMAGLEVFHSDHDEAAVARYAALARACGLAMTGGSDYHGTDDCGRELGAVSLPPEHLADFLSRRG